LSSRTKIYKITLTNICFCVISIFVSLLSFLFCCDIKLFCDEKFAFFFKKLWLVCFYLFKVQIKMKIVKWILFVLVIVGALNQWLVGIFDFDLVAFVLGDMTMMARVVYSLVWVSAVALMAQAIVKKSC